MDKTNKISDFLNEDIAYLLGLIVGKGVFVPDGQTRRLIITFPYKTLVAEGYHSTYDKPLELSNSLDVVVNRIRKHGFDVTKENRNKNDIALVITWHREDLSWQILAYLLNHECTDFHSFRIPRAVFETDKEIQKEFLRGYFDTTGNWLVIADLARLLDSIGVSIHTIDFGHPNFRDPEFKKTKGFWAKEHQLKIYANQFAKIGSYLHYKNAVLKDLADENNSNLGEEDNEKESRVKEKPVNTEENSEKLPEFLRGKHFNHWRELLKYLITVAKHV